MDVGGEGSGKVAPGRRVCGCSGRQVTAPPGTRREMSQKTTLCHNKAPPIAMLATQSAQLALVLCLPAHQKTHRWATLQHVFIPYTKRDKQRQSGAIQDPEIQCTNILDQLCMLQPLREPMPAQVLCDIFLHARHGVWIPSNAAPFRQAQEKIAALCKARNKQFRGEFACAGDGTRRVGHAWHIRCRAP